MAKEYTAWHDEKSRLDDLESNIVFHEREIWWCSLGKNIGHELDGGSDFMRPVLIIKKYNLDTCLIVPLTTRAHESNYYFPVGKIRDRENVAILSQLRHIDRKRLANKIGQLNEIIYQTLIQRIVEVTFPYKNTLPALAGGEQAEAVVLNEYIPEPDQQSSPQI